MPFVRFMTPVGEPLEVTIKGDDDRVAHELVELTAQLDGVWVYADGLSDPSHAMFVPAGTVIDVQFDSGMTPDPLRRIGFTLGGRD